jgi:hypothetical protein
MGPDELCVDPAPHQLHDVLRMALYRALTDQLDPGLDLSGDWIGDVQWQRVTQSLDEFAWAYAPRSWRWKA